jgi:hypothetical protein
MGKEGAHALMEGREWIERGEGDKSERRVHLRILVVPKVVL